jgi:2-keto-4-pentenoate hydratase
MHAIPESETIAASLVHARKNGRSLPAFPGRIPATLGEAYKVQDSAIVRVAERVGGWKVGRIMPPLDHAWGSGRLAGPILARSIHDISQTGSTATKPIGQVYVGGFGAAEAEFLFRIGAVPDLKQKTYSLDNAAALVDRVHIGIEIASSPLATINQLGPPVIISDFGNNNGLIIGPEVSDWRHSNFPDWPVETWIDGVCAGRGAANAFPDGPIGSVRFLLELMAARGVVLEAGTWVSTGAITGVHDVEVGQTVETQFNTPKGTLVTSCSIAAAHSEAALPASV